MAKNITRWYKKSN